MGEFGESAPRGVLFVIPDDVVLAFDHEGFLDCVDETGEFMKLRDVHHRDGDCLLHCWGDTHLFT